MLIKIVSTGQVIEASPSVPPGYFFSRHGLFSTVDAVPFDPPAIASEGEPDSTPSTSDPDPATEPAIASDSTPSTSDPDPATEPAIASEGEPDSTPSTTDPEGEPPQNEPKPKSRRR